MTTLTYAVELDFLPFRRFIVQAESESEARLQVATETQTPYEQTSATLI